MLVISQSMGEHWGVLAGSAFDWVFEPDEHNAASSRGVRVILDSITAVRRYGLLWIACECSSFTVLCRSVSLRSEANDWYGDTTKQFVVTGNLLMTVSALFYFIGFALQIHVVVEQPQNSCLEFCHPIKAVFQYTKTNMYRTYLGSFGGNSVKPLSLYSTWNRLSAMECEKPQGQSQLVTRSDSGFTGLKDELHQSQEYTCAFGRSVCGLLRDETISSTN